MIFSKQVPTKKLGRQSFKVLLLPFCNPESFQCKFQQKCEVVEVLFLYFLDLESTYHLFNCAKKMKNARNELCEVVEASFSYFLDLEFIYHLFNCAQKIKNARN